MFDEKEESFRMPLNDNDNSILFYEENKGSALANSARTIEVISIDGNGG